MAVIRAGMLIDGVYCFKQSHDGNSVKAFHTTTISPTYYINVLVTRRFRQ